MKVALKLRADGPIAADFTGDAVFQKTYTDGSFNRHHNKGEKDRYLIQNHHEPIISHEDFEAAQAALEQRGKERGVEKHLERYQNRYPFSGKIICGSCGDTFKRRVHTSGKHRTAWCCNTHLSDIGRCPMKYIPGSSLEYAFVTMMNKLIFGNQAVLKPLLFSLRRISADDGLERIHGLEIELEENAKQQTVLVGLMTKKYLEPAIYKKSNNELLREAERIRRQIESISRLLEL